MFVAELNVIDDFARTPCQMGVTGVKCEESMEIDSCEAVFKFHEEGA